jgi:phage tail-like protein
MSSNTARSAISRFSKLQTDPLRNFRFIVDFRVTSDTQGPNSFTEFRGGFTSVSGLSISTQGIAYREGGMNTTLHQIPGMTTFQPVTLSRGVILGQDEAINWMKQLFAAASGEGIPGADRTSYRCNLDIYVLDHPVTGAPLISANDVVSTSAYKMKFTVHNAWITNLSYSDLNASDNQLMYETIQLVHEGMSVKLADYGASV